MRHQQRTEKRAFLEDIVRGLPTVTKDEVEPEDVCGICLLPFEALLHEEEAESKRREEGSKREDEEEDKELQLGLTKVECGHVFCRKDLTEWIKGFHGSCPACRHVFIDISPPDDTDDESSDGGEYIPDPGEFDDEDEGTVDFTDGFSDDRDLEQEYAQESAEFEAELALEFAHENAIADALEEQEAELAAETAELEALEDLEEQRRALEEEFAHENAIADALEEQEADFAAETTELEALEEQRALEEEFAYENALADALEEQEALEQEFGSDLEHLEALAEQEALEEELAAEGLVYDDERMDIMDEQYTGEAFMDVYLSDSSSDVDYEPDDYAVLDSDTEMSSDIDHSIEELECLDKYPDPIAIHGRSSSDSLLALVTDDVKVSPSPRAGRAPREEV
ncbi:hypothetical protein EST38_g565 [Candolleomyces aberdarensis]|uniref:RING-type domain-containing protein n=1 Tax=Candolleomyces aberdarensis TaxID=2316362 RepID=A0A4Q2E0A6_9AGAR|nr:hypothetical protein EST38_g565 [Candolleomyces aberdarensis]